MAVFLPGRFAVGLVLVAAPSLAAAQAPVELAGAAGAPDLLARELETEEQARALTEDLARLGAPALPELFAILASGVFTPGATPDERADAPADAPTNASEGGEAEPRELDPLRREAVLDAISLLSPTAVRAYLTGLDRAALTQEQRCAALQVYGAIGAAEDLRSLVAVAAPIDPRALIAPELRRAFLEATVLVLARDERAAGSVRGAFDVAHPSLQAELVAALRRARPPQALAVLGALIGVSPELDLLVLAAIGDVARESGQPIEADVGSAVLRCLSGQDERLAQAAAAALAELEDPRAVPDLILLLDSANANLRAGADRALVRTAGRDFRGDLARWQAWYDAEQTWWVETEVELLASLRSERDVDVASALNEVASHRLFRRELEYRLLEELADDDPLIVATACITLGRLGSRAAAADLEALAAHSDPRISQAARVARRRIPGPPTVLPPEKPPGGRRGDSRE